MVKLHIIFYTCLYHIDVLHADPYAVVRFVFETVSPIWVIIYQRSTGRSWRLVEGIYNLKSFASLTEWYRYSNSHAIKSVVQFTQRCVKKIL